MFKWNAAGANIEAIFLPQSISDYLHELAAGEH